jgi:hypothetical protein
MKSRVVVTLAAGLLVTIAAGWHYRSLAGVQDTSLMSAAAEKLAGIPLTIGKWKVIRENSLSTEVVDMLQCSAHVNRVYQHEETKQTVSIVVLLGPHGPMAVHIPEVCYSNSGFKSDSQATNCTLNPASGGGSNQFWRVSMRSMADEELVQHVFYGWSEGDRWSRPAYPRWAFGRAPYLYKLQMATTDVANLNDKTEGGGGRAKNDAAEKFLEEFIEAARPFVVLPSSLRNQQG